MPKTDPNWVRTTLCEDYAELAKKNGEAVPASRDIEAGVDAMIQNFEGHQRNAKPNPRRGKKRKPEDNAGHKLAEKLGYKLVKRPVTSDSSPKACTFCGNKQACRRCRLFIRVRRLMRVKTVKPLEFDFPRLASDIMRQTTWCNLKLHQYATESSVQRNRALLVALENIADRSVPYLGEWRP